MKTLNSNKYLHISETEAEAYYRWSVDGFDHSHIIPDKTPRWWRRIFV